MKKNYFTLNTYILFACIFFACVSSLSAQVKNDFDVRYQDNIRGDITFIGNNIVNRKTTGNWWEPSKSPNDSYDESSSNDGFNMHYIDVDNDGSTFSSSSAELSIPDPECSRVIYAGLYWSAVYKYNEGGVANSGRENDWNSVKLKTPGNNYTQLVADEVLFNGFGDSDFGNYSPYACYKDITTLIQSTSNPTGEYTVANIRASSGYGTSNSSDGLTGGISGGWSLVIIYENPTLKGKKITTFDGYAGIKSGESLDIPVKGFRTLPEPFPVNAKMGVMAMEGDRGISGDQLRIKADSKTTYTNLYNNANPSSNFFNGSISLESDGDAGVINPNRTPNSINTLGWDVDLMEISNSNWSVIPNDETGVTLRAISTQDKYDIFFTSFDVEIIEPDMQLAKRVFDTDGNDIQGQEVALGQEIQYSLSFDNIGNDDGTNFTIKDILPVNVDFISAELPPAIDEMGQLKQITYTYDITTNELIFTIPDIYVEVPRDDYTIKINVRVQEDCDKLRDACSNIIQNQAYATYQGVLNDNEISDDPSVSGFDTCNFGIPGSTNFLPNLDECNFEREIAICGDSIKLIAGANYDTYQWFFQNPDGTYRALTGVIDGALGQTYTATNYGTYKVEKKITEPCKDYDEIITVVPRSNDLTSPFASVADQVVTCPNDGTLLPKFFLCGTNDDRILNVSFPDAVALVWQKLDDNCSAASIEDDCPSKDNSCTWNDVGTGDQYELSGPGEYRLEVRYQNNCFNRFYFKAYENSVDPTITKEDIICDTKGRIDISGIGKGYEYAIALSSNVFDPNTATWQDETSFEVEIAGTYNVYIRQANIDLEEGDREPCLFKFENVVIAKRNFTVNVSENNPFCSDAKGSFDINVDGARAWYTYVIKDEAGAVVDDENQSDDNFHQFAELDPGTYSIEVTTEDGCTFSEPYTIIAPENMELNAVVSQNVSCREGNIQVHSNGGQNPHKYAIWSYIPASGATSPEISYSNIDEIPAEAIQSEQIFDVYIGEQGTYSYVVFDKNNCYAFSNEVTIIVEPDIEFSVDHTDETCIGSEDGTITVGIDNAHNYNISYSIDGVDFDGTNTFSNLETGTYTVTVRGMKEGVSCDFTKEVTIEPGVQISADANLTNDYTCLENGQITFGNATGGSGIFEYSIDGVNWQDSPVFNNLTAGTFTPSYRDKNNPDCVQETNEITVDPLTPPTDISFNTTVPQCPAQTSNVTLSVVGGAGLINYEIIAPASSVTVNGTNNIFNGLAAGNTYTFKVTDEKGCTYNENLTIPLSTPIGVVGQLISNVSCVNGSDGEIRYTVSGFITNYNYTVVDASNTEVQSSATPQTNSIIDITGLEAGVYTITVTDPQTDCTDTDTVTIEEPTSQLVLGTPDITHESCSPTGTNLGAITISASGGWGSFTYELYGGAGNLITSNGTGSFSNLSAGDYIIQVIDANECDIDSTTITIDSAIAPDLNLSPNNVCYDATEGLTITASITPGTGSGILSYTLNGGRTNTTGSFDKLGPGTYTVTVTDEKNCTDTETITVNPELDVIASANPISACGTSTDVTITATGGDGNYVYAIVPDGNTPNSFSTTNPVNITTAGDYDVYVRDHAGGTGYCEAKYDITITADPELKVTASNTKILCNGTTSTLTITAGGGSGNYTGYSIDKGSTFQPSNVFNNLISGNYNIVVKDSQGCEVELFYTINQPQELTASANVAALVECNPSVGADVRITNAQGGTIPYEYSFDGGSSYGASATQNLMPGTYELYVKDASGCIFGPMPITVEEGPEEPELDALVDYNCDGTGSITVNASPSTYDYTYQLNGGTEQVSNEFEGVAPGTHDITVNYISNLPATPIPEKCPLSKDIKVIVEDGHKFTAEVIGTTNVSCNADNNSEVTISVTNFGASGYEYSLDDFATILGTSTSATETISVGLEAGTYTLSVRDIDNQSATPSLACSKDLLFIITEPDPVVVTAQITSEITCNVATATITATTATGGTPGYTYQLEDISGIPIAGYEFATNGTNRVFSNLPIGDYIVRAKDSKDCDDTSETLSVSAPDSVTFTATPTACVSGVYTPQIEVEITGGNNDYLVSLSDGSGVFYKPNVDDDSHIFYNLDPGTYEVTVKDGYGCSANVKTVIVRDDLDADVDVTHIACVDGKIEVTASGGDGNYEYSFDGGNSYGTSNTYAVTSGNGGSYDVAVKDGSGACVYEETVQVNELTPISITVTPTQPKCHDEKGAIQIDIFDGVGPYVIVINDGTFDVIKEKFTGTSTTFYNLSAANYTVTVTDNYGCFDDKTLIITNPDELTADINPFITDCGSTPDDFGFAIENLPAYYTSGGFTIEYTDGIGSWQTSNEFNTYNPGDVVNPKVRVTNTNTGNICSLDMGRYIIPYPLDDLNIEVYPIIVNCNEMIVTVEGTEGDPGYEYTYTNDPSNFDPNNPSVNWTSQTPFGGPHVYEYYNLIPGRTYVFYVRDDSGCIRQSSVNVNDLVNLPMDIEVEYEASCSGANDGQISFTLTDDDGTVEPYIRYELYELGNLTPIYSSTPTNVPFNSPETYSIPISLPPGEYYVQVTQHDGTTDACVAATENILIEELDPISGTPAKIRNITCETPGLIQVSDITGGGEEYTYTLTSTDFDIDGDGIYDPAIDFITTTDNPMEVSIDDILDPTVNSIVVDVNVEDQYECGQYLGQVTLNISQAPEIDAVITDNCDGNASITVNVDATTGLAPYYYSMDGGATYGLAGENEFTGLTTGTYEIMVLDSNGCTVAANADVEIYEPLAFAELEVREALDCQSGDEDAKIFFEVEGGSSVDASTNILYSISGPAGFTNPVTEVPIPSTATPPNSRLFTGANVPGTYTITLKDAQTGCIISRKVEVPEKLVPEVSGTPITTDVTCYNDADGTITVTAKDNATGPYTFEIIARNGTPFSMAPTASNGYQATFTGLAGAIGAGITYTIEITANSNNACTSLPIDATIYQPENLTGLTLNVTEFACTTGNAVNLASVTASGATGGTGTYVYEFIYNNGTPGDTSDDITRKDATTTFNVSNHAGGNVVVNVYDEKGCFISDNIDIKPYNKLEQIVTIPTNPTCNGGDGAIQVDATLASGAIGSDILEYRIFDETGTEITSEFFRGNTDTYTFNNLDIGSYEIRVSNYDTGCELITTEELTDPNTFDIDLDITSSVVCLGSQTGEISVELIDANGTPSYSGPFTWRIDNTNGTPVDNSDDTFAKNGNSTDNGPITIDQFEAGTYIIYVTQDNNPQCTQEKVFTIATPSANLTATASVTAQTCSLNDGIIEITNVSGGWGGYKYYVDTTPIADENDITNYFDSPRFQGLATGTYEIWVIDQKGCSVQLPSEEIINPTPITGDINASTQNCEGLSGEITVDNVTGGSGGLYTFQLIKDGVDFGAPQTGMTTVFTGLGAGDYEVRISDNWDCSVVLLTPITLYEEIALNYTIDSSISCDASNNNLGGQVTIDAIGGNGLYTFEVEYPNGTTANNGSIATFTGLDQVGTYIFTVTDGVGCDEQIDLELEAPIIPELIISKKTNVSCEGLSDGTIKATVNSSTSVNPPYTYVLTGPITATNTSGLFTGLPAGNYTITVSSVLGCFDEEIVEITEPSALDFMAVVTTEFSCNPDNTIAVGQITVNVDPITGTAPYLYSIDGTNYQNSNVFDVVDTGNDETYTLYVKDANGCFDTYPVTINTLPKITAVGVTPVRAITCANTEEVAVTIVGGSGDFSVELLPVGPTKQLIGQTINFDLPTPGDYVFQVTDNVTGCFFITAPYTVNPYNTIKATANASSSVSCIGSATGEITINVSDYIGDYTYEVFASNGTSIGVTGSGIASTPIAISGIPAGNYYVEVIALDSPYCPATSNTVNIKSPTKGLDLNAVVTEDLSCITNQAEIVATATGGWGSYQYALVIQGATPSTGDYSVNNIFTNVSAGIYEVYVKDAEGCEEVETVTLTQPIPINATATATSIDVLCEGDKTGSITVTGVTGGRPDFDATVEYLYILNRLDQSGGVISSSAPQLSNVFNNLGAGDYSVTVTDNHDCDFVTLPVSVTEPTEVFASLRLVAGNTCTTGATLELTVTGGTGSGYEYSTSANSGWMSMSGNSIQIDVPEPITTTEMHQYYVRDSNGCISNISNSVTISPIRPLEITPTVVADVSCYDEATGYIKVDVTGGLGDYLYTLFDVSGNVVVRPQQSGNTFSDLPAGVYFVEVESGDCIAQERIQIEEGEELTSKEPVIFNPICSDDLGSIELELQGGSGVYQYAISPNLDQFQNKNVFEDLEPGTYTIIAQDSKGCNPFVYKKEIVAPSPVAAKANILEKEFCAGDKTASFEINIEGGTPPYYTALNTQEDDKFIENKTMFDGLEGGETYVVFVKDANGCSTNVIVTLDKSVDLSPRAEMSQNCFDNSAVNEVTIMLAQDNLEDVIYTLDGGVDQFENRFSNLAPGKHTVTVSYFGCEKTVDFTVDPIVPLNLSVGESNINEFTILPTGGAAPYEYFIDGVSNGNDSKYVIRESGVYEVKVIDANGCEVVAQIEMEFIDIDVPNVFTPDGDNNNDTWTPKNTLLYPKIVTKIYDRYGRVVAELRVGDEWDGRYNGALLPTGDYWYVIKLNGAEDDREFVGHFTLYR